jgi:type IV pilus assembly protein PilA
MKTMIMKRMALKAKDKKGFTLVEVIVVLVILAILMAIAVPALTGYIGKARDKAAEAEGKTVLTAVQTYVTEKGITSETGLADNEDAIADISYLIGEELTGDSTVTTEATKTIAVITVDVNGKVTDLTYYGASKDKIVYDVDADPQFKINPTTT